MAAARITDPDRKLFADELKAMRGQRGWSQEEAGRRINYSASTIANIESGLRAPTRRQAQLLDEAFGTPGTFERLEERIRGVPFSSGFRPFAPYEAEALVLRSWEHSLVPGLFQTEEYARAILEANSDATPEDVKERLAARMARQAILYREEPAPPRVWALLNEHVLNLDIGDPAVMHRQVEHLIEIARMPRNNIQTIPPGRMHAGLRGAFAIAELAQPPAIVYYETASQGLTVENPDSALEIAALFDTLRMVALPGDASLRMLEEAGQRWKERAETSRGASPPTVPTTAATASKSA